MKQFVARGTNQGFRCLHCGKDVPALQGGSYRNHCPYCLYSLHVDINPGDRASDCKGLLKPITLDYNSKKGWIIVHQCQRCGDIRRNKAATDDPIAPDDFDRLLELSSSEQR